MGHPTCTYNGSHLHNWNGQKLHWIIRGHMGTVMKIIRFYWIVWAYRLSWIEWNGRLCVCVWESTIVSDIEWLNRMHLPNVFHPNEIWTCASIVSCCLSAQYTTFHAILNSYATMEFTTQTNARCTCDVRTDTDIEALYCFISFRHHLSFIWKIAF